MICTACKTENPAGNHFCGNCGAALASPERIMGNSRPAAPPAGERRRLVVLFSDIVASTEIAGRLDPEEWRELLSDYHGVVNGAVTRFGGHVAKYLGDGVMAYFGWPEVHESDSERAALAGRAILDAIATINREGPERPTLATRIGVHAGEVVVDPTGEVYGDTPNVAARVQSIALPDSVVVTEPVFQSIANRLATETIGYHALRGIDGPMRLHRVLSTDRVPTARHPTASETPFVGRSTELRTILEAWERARGGAARVVVVTGEAGIGKSRLLREFQARIAAEPHLWLTSGGSDIFRSTPFYPVIQILNRLVGPHDLGPSRRRRRLGYLLESAGLEASQSLPLIGELLSIEGSDRDSALKPAERRAQWLKALVTWMIEAAKRQPAVLEIEDLHWVDPSTIEVLEALVEATDTSLLVLLTARPEFRAPWPVHSHHTHIVLGRLDRSEIREIVRGAATAASLQEYVVNSIADRTSGIPLFAEELARLVEVRGNGGSGKPIPGTLTASLTARLDQVGPARTIAQIAAVIGDEFDPDLLAAVSGDEPDSLVPLLDRLIANGILVSRIAAEGRLMAFRHSLLRDAAYETLLRSRRRELHERIADAIVDRFPAVARDHPEIVARHLSLAEDHERAVESWRQAGSVAAGRAAYREAEEAYREALSEIERLPESPERDQRHLSIRNALITVLQVTQGYSAPRTTEVVEPTRQLSEKIGDVGQSMPQLTAAWAALSSAGKYAEARQLADRFLDLARRDGRGHNLASAHMMQMTLHYRMGDLVEAERHFLAGQRFFDNDVFKAAPGAIAQTFGNAARNVWMLGRPDEARRRMAYALDVAAANNSPYDTAFAQYMAAILAVLMHNRGEARRLAELSMELSDKNGYPQFAAISRIALGRALVGTERSSEAVGLIERGIAGMTATGSRVAVTLYLAWLAEAHAADGALGEAQESIDRAFSSNPEELFVHPELRRIRGELLAAAGDIDRAEAEIRSAMAAAHDMGALSLQLRAALSLHRLLAQGGGPGAANVVASVYARFTEGLDAPDLIDAAALTRNSGRP